VLAIVDTRKRFKNVVVAVAKKDQQSGLMLVCQASIWDFRAFHLGKGRSSSTQRENRCRPEIYARHTNLSAGLKFNLNRLRRSGAWASEGQRVNSSRPGSRQHPTSEFSHVNHRATVIRRFLIGRHQQRKLGMLDRGRRPTELDRKHERRVRVAN
jgi:hypothetical protein